MERFLSELKRNSHICLLQLFILLFCLLTAVVCELSLFDGIIYTLYQFLGIFIPGLALVELFGIKKCDGNAEILWAYSLGILVVLFEYLILMGLKIAKLSGLISLILAILSCFYLYKRKDEKQLLNDDFYLLLFLVLMIVLFAFFSISLPNPVTNVKHDLYLNKDFLFWVGNNISFTKGLPVQDFRLVGVSFYYHHFSNALIAQCSLISGIDVLELSYYFSYIIPCIMMVFAAYELLSTLLKNEALLYLGMILILFTEGSTVFLANHLYFCPFGFDYAYALSMLGISVLCKASNDDAYGLKKVLITCVLIGLTTGFKGPVSLVSLIGFGFVCLDLLLKKRWKEGLVYGVLWLFSFLSIYLIFISDLSGQTIEENGLEFLGVLRAFDQNYWANDILNDLISKGFPNNGLSRILALGLYVLNSDNGAMSLLIVSLVWQLCVLIRKKRVMFISLLLCIISVWGILLTINTYQNGNSQMYFIMSGFPYAILAGLMAIEAIGQDKRSFLYIGLLLVCLVSFRDIRRFFFERVKPVVEDGIAAYRGDYKQGISRNLFTVDDYRLCLWLRDNTNEEDYIAIDTFEYDEIKKEENFGVFSKRFIWNDGQYADHVETERRRKMVNDLFDGDPNALERLKDEGVSYLVQTLSQSLDLQLTGLHQVYSDDNYKVYKVE